MKTTQFIIYTALAAITLSACSDFLSTEDYTRKDSSNFPLNEDDAQQSLTGCYSMLRTMTDDREAKHPMIVAEVLSDDRFAGGGPDDAFLKNLDKLTAYSNDMFDDLWEMGYKGVHRCNQLIEQIPQIQFSTDKQRAEIDGEARFLRAYFYLNLARYFGNIPLITTNISKNEPQAKPEDIYAFIANDLTTAISEMDDTPANEISTERLGHANKWAAEGLLARAFLFYTGYYRQNSLKTTSGETLDAQKVADILKDCIEHSGYKLMPDYRCLWPYSNAYTAPDYPYARENNLKWYGEQGDNLETIFAIRYSAKADWPNSQAHTNNQVNLFFSPRESDGSVENNFPLGTGWGVGTISPKMIADWKAYEPQDLRLYASVFDVQREAPNYVWGADRQQDETGLWQKKYCAIDAKHTVDGETLIENFSRLMYPGVNADYQLNNIQDIVILRFADILLMHSELTHTVDGINSVRKRVALPPVSTYSDNVLRNERRFELAFEGLRWFDLLRWHIAENAMRAVNGITVKNSMEDYQPDMNAVAKRIEETQGLLQIPQTQISLSGGVLKQNKGW